MIPIDIVILYNIKVLLPKRLARANSRKEEPCRNLSNIIASSPGQAYIVSLYFILSYESIYTEKFTEEDIVNWYTQEVQAEQHATTRHDLASKIIYVQYG